MDKIKALLDELAAVVAEMETMSETPVEGDEPAITAEEESSLRSLEAKADKLRERIEFLQRLQVKELELRAVLERAAPAKAIESPEVKETAVETRHYAVPKGHGPLKGFVGPTPASVLTERGCTLRALSLVMPRPAGGAKITASRIECKAAASTRSAACSPARNSPAKSFAWSRSSACSRSTPSGST